MKFLLHLRAYIGIIFILAILIPNKVYAATLDLELRPNTHQTTVNNIISVTLYARGVNTSSVNVNAILSAVKLPKELSISNLLFNLNSNFVFNYLTTTDKNSYSQIEFMFVKYPDQFILINDNTPIISFDITTNTPGTYKIENSSAIPTNIYNDQNTDVFGTYNPPYLNLTFNALIPTPSPTPTLTPSPSPTPIVPTPSPTPVVPTPTPIVPSPSPTIVPTPILPTPSPSPSPVVPSPTPVIPTPSPTPQNKQIIISNIKLQGVKNFTYVTGGLNTLAKQYLDRRYRFTYVPQKYQGLDYLQTYNKDKFSTGDNAISFTTNIGVRVYIAHDTRIKTKPSWLNNFTKTNSVLIAQMSAPFEIFYKDFKDGKVIIGGNQQQGKKAVKNSSNYTVFLEPL